MQYSEPNPESKKDLIFYANRAMVDEIRPYIRKISIQYIKDENCIILYFYLDTPLSQDDLDSDALGAIVTEMCAHFSEKIMWDEKVTVIPYPEVVHFEGTCIYGRYEGYY